MNILVESWKQDNFSEEEIQILLQRHMEEEV